MAGYAVTFSVVDNATKQIDAINRKIAATRAPIEKMQKTASRFLDVSGLRGVANGFSNVARAAQDAFLSMSAIVPVMGTLVGAASLAGMAKLVSSWAAFGLTLNQDAQRANQTAGELQALQNAGQQLGVTAQDMTSVLTKLQDVRTDALAGRNPEAIAAMNQLGIAFRDANGHIKTNAQLLPEIIDKIGKLPDPTNRAHFAEVLLGASGFKVGTAFEWQSAKLEEATRKAERHGVVTGEQIEIAKRFREAQEDVSQSISGVMNNITASLGRAFTPMLEKMSEWIDKNRDVISAKVDEYVKRFSDYLASIDWDKVIKGAEAFLKACEPLLKVMEAIGKAIAYIVEQMAKLAPYMDNIEKLARILLPGYGAGMTLLDKFGPGGTLTAPAPGGGAPPAPGAPGAPAAGGGSWWSRNAPSWLGGSSGATRSAVPQAESFENRSDFIKKAWPMALEASKATGVDPRMIVAQAGVETGWGKHAPNNNYFGIKGQGATQTTQEFVNGQMVTTQASFRGYENMAGSFKGYADFINQNQRYGGYKGGMTLEEQATALQRSGYATDPNYGGKVLDIAKQIDLDKLGLGTGAPVQMAQNTTAPSGEVNVRVVHENPPPGTKVAATGTGNVNVEPPRTERAALVGP